MTRVAKDEGAETAKTKAKPAKRLGIATVVKPCVVGVMLLGALHGLLPAK